MSAWIVSRKHIDLLTAALIEHGIAPNFPDLVGQMLWQENLRSVAYRYPNDRDGERPGPVGFRDSMVESYTYRGPQDVSDSALVLKQAHCFDYQSCEHPEYADSEACTWVRKLCEKLDGERAGQSAAYNAAPWGID